MSSTTTLARIAAALTLAVVLAACNPIVIGPDGVISSSASRAVDPITVRVRGVAQPGIQIRIRDCKQVELRRPGHEPIDIGLQPHATIIDATGKTIYWSHDYLDQPQVRPLGSYEVPSASDGSHHIVVPVGGATAPLTIRTRCDAYSIGSHGFYPMWTFPTCTTANRRCAASPRGAGEWST